MNMRVPDITKRDASKAALAKTIIPSEGSAMSKAIRPQGEEALKARHGIDKPGIEYRHYERIAPGVYRAHSATARVYFDKIYKRWLCLILWDVLSEDLQHRIARIPLWWALGRGHRKYAARRSKYFAEWVKANNGPPIRGDRLSPKVFEQRFARVEIGDTDVTKSAAPYSVVKRIIDWETGRCRVN